MPEASCLQTQRSEEILMKLQRIASPTETRMLNTEDLQGHFLVRELFRAGQANLVYTDLDRAVVGGIWPKDELVRLDAADQLRSTHFFERREGGVLNVGQGLARASVDGVSFELPPESCLYIGLGSREVSFENLDPESACHLYFVSYPAHAEYPTRLAGRAEANEVRLGDSGKANERILYQFIHPNGIQSCQLVMGFTRILSGSVWNTMPPHTHERRSEVYLYFNLSPDEVVFHFMGEPDYTRHLVVRDRELILSPSWSIHAGCGTSNYDFVWAMGGENQRFDDMDMVSLRTIR